MVFIHQRTITFLASVASTFQCILWLLGFILYVITYSCGYKTFYFDDTGPVLPINFKSYYIWYFQGYNCTTSLDWIGHVRGNSPQLLVALISVGFLWNIFLLSTSIYMLVGLYSNSLKIALNQKLFASSLLVVSLWDLILVIIVSIDFSPLMDVKNYQIFSNHTGPFLLETPEIHPNVLPTKGLDVLSPSVFALPYFSEVFTVVIMLLSRFILFWILNVLSASYILVKHTNDGSKGNPNTVPFNNGSIKPQHNPDPPKNEWDNRLSNRIPRAGMPTPIEDKMFFAQDRLERQVNPNIALRDEVNRRWNVNVWTQPVFSEEKMDNVALNRQDLIRQDLNRQDLNRQDLNRQNLNRQDSLQPKPHFNEATISDNTQRSILNKPIPHVPSKPVEHLDTNAFVYMPGSRQAPFVKLKPIAREPKETESPVVMSENSGSDNNSANPYMVSTLSNLDLTYTPRSLFQVPPPPPREPVSKMDTPQISLEEAIRTRRPLKPVGTKTRPSIDTNC